jgi:hypothetical protein
MTGSDIDLKVLRATFARGVYFHGVSGQLTHNAGCLVEGLMDLGIPVRLAAAEFTSRPVSMPLAGVDTKAMVSPLFTDFSAYVVDISHTNAPAPIQGVDPGRVIYLNQSDVATFCETHPSIPMFATHENLFLSKGGPRFPLAFGLSKGLIAATEHRPNFRARKRQALRNFRPTLNQSLRALLDLTFVPRLETQMPIDRQIHGPAAYTEGLLNSAVCLAYGGGLYSTITDNPWFRTNAADLMKTHTFARSDAPAFVLRWDSWRLWESFAAGCVTVHLDFEKYGFALPVMPKAWEHYVPIDLDDIAGSAQALMDRSSEWEDIAERGRAFALNHYAPAPTAQYVLNTALSHTLLRTTGAAS